jgi:hypothetical protein
MVFMTNRTGKAEERKLRPKGWCVRLIFEGSYDAGFNSLLIRPFIAFGCIIFVEDTCNLG